MSRLIYQELELIQYCNLILMILLQNIFGINTNTSKLVFVLSIILISRTLEFYQKEQSTKDNKKLTFFGGLGSCVHHTKISG